MARGGSGDEPPRDPKFGDEWYVPAVDSKGHSVREYVRLPPGMSRAIDEILQSGDTPYKTRSDLIRHAVDVHLNYLHGILPHVTKTYTGALKVMAEVVRDDEYRSDTEKLFRTLQERIDKYLEQGDVPEAVRVIGICKRELANIEDSGWKRRFLEKFNRRFHQYLRGGTVIEMPKKAAAASDDD